MAERFAREDVGEVYLNEGEVHRRQRIAQRDAGVCESGRIDDDEVGPVPGGLLDPIDQSRFGVALEKTSAAPAT